MLEAGFPAEIEWIKEDPTHSGGHETKRHAPGQGEGAVGNAGDERRVPPDNSAIDGVGQLFRRMCRRARRL